jgi:hypothetical protein
VHEIVDLFEQEQRKERPTFAFARQNAFDKSVLKRSAWQFNEEKQEKNETAIDRMISLKYMSPSLSLPLSPSLSLPIQYEFILPYFDMLRKLRINSSVRPYLSSDDEKKT